MGTEIKMIKRFFSWIFRTPKIYTHGNLQDQRDIVQKNFRIF